MARKPKRRSVALRKQAAALDALHERLVGLYGEPIPGPPLPPLDEVVITILSQNTTDTNRDRAWERLRSRFPDWQSVVDAPVEEVEAALEPGGLHRVKAVRIRETLCEVRDRHGDYDLDHLLEASTADARQELASVKGLGAKSVNCILLFSLGKPAFPVDTHVYRILQRVGVHRCRDLTRANDEMQEAVADEISYPLHVNLIRHGREVCLARRPRCGVCGIRDLCAWPDKTG
jgi:endonuclease-3